MLGDLAGELHRHQLLHRPLPTGLTDQTGQVDVLFDVPGIVGAGVGENEQGRPTLAVLVENEQVAADIFLERPDVRTDRGLSVTQFLCGLGEAQMARRRLEGAQGVQRW